MRGNFVDDGSPDLLMTSPEASPTGNAPPGYQAEAPPAPASAATTSQSANESAFSSQNPAPPKEASPPDGGGSYRRRDPWRYLIPLMLLLALVVGIGGGYLGAKIESATTSSTQSANLSDSVNDVQQAVENVSRNVQPSVVEITSRGDLGTAIASGDILTKDGYIVTNDHAVNGFSTFTVTLSDGTALPARVVGEDERDDLAVVKITARGLSPITFADSNTLKVGQFVVALGSPVGFENSTTFGVVSALNRTLSESSDIQQTELTGLVQTNATLNPGNSGGALLDLQGRLVGIPTLGIIATPTGESVQGMGFAIPSNRVKTVTNQIIQHEQPPTLTPTPLTPTPQPTPSGG